MLPLLELTAVKQTPFTETLAPFLRFSVKELVAKTSIVFPEEVLLHPLISPIS